jgi:uncharacterized protein (DUF39 family)
MFVGIGIPIPVLDEEMLRYLIVEDKDIYTEVSDYSKREGDVPPLATVNYAQLKSGWIELDGKKVRTSPMTSLSKSREIASILKEQIASGQFFLTEPVMKFPIGNTLHSLKIRSKRARGGKNE